MAYDFVYPCWGKEQKLNQSVVAQVCPFPALNNKKFIQFIKYSWTDQCSSINRSLISVEPDDEILLVIKIVKKFDSPMKFSWSNGLLKAEVFGRPIPSS